MRTTITSKETNSVLRNGHSEDVAHPAATAEDEQISTQNFTLLPLLMNRQLLNHPWRKRTLWVEMS